MNARAFSRGPRGMRPFRPRGGATPAGFRQRAIWYRRRNDVLGLLTPVAAFGISRSTRWSRPLAFEYPGRRCCRGRPGPLRGQRRRRDLGRGGQPIVPSILTMGLLLRPDQHTMQTA